MSKWLSNVPIPRVKFSESLNRSDQEKLQSLLEFIQREQPNATMDFLIEDVLDAFLRKNDTSIPPPEEKVTLRVTIPKDIDERIEALVEEAAEEDPRINSEALFNYAVTSFMGRSTNLLRSWRKEVKRQEEEQAQRGATSGEGASAAKAKTETEPDSKTEAKTETEPDSKTEAKTEAKTDSEPESVIDRIRREKNLGGDGSRNTPKSDSAGSTA